MKTYYYLYQITNLVNAKIYVGVHRTQNLNDGYMGSGKVIKWAIEKHGIDNFRKDILEFFEDAKAMYAKEKEIVTKEFLLREDVYNLRRGGHGGFDYINQNQMNGFCNKTVAKKARQCTNKILEMKYGKDWHSIISKIGNKKANTVEAKRKSKATKLKNNTFGKTCHMNTEEMIQKKKKIFANIKHQQGKNNSQYNTCWVYFDFIGNKKIKKDLLPLYIDQGWKKGRKI